jgi:site-specific DNA-methyltransferase (adenine-specific)
MLTPYWQSDDGLIQVYHGDMLDVLPRLGAFDVVVTDAPFAIKDAAMRMGPMGGTRRGDNTWHAPSTWDNAFDPKWGPAVCAAAPVVAWFGQWRKRPEVEAFMPHPIRCEIVWAKDMHVGPPCPAAMRDERIWIFSARGFEPQHFETTVWDEPVIPTWEHKWHKNQKPERLMGRLIRWVAPPGARIIDPFMGSGSTLVAAKTLGFRCVGIDASEEHCESAVIRLGGAGKRAAEPVGPLFSRAS